MWSRAVVNRGRERVHGLLEVCVTEPCSLLCYCANGVSTDRINAVSGFQVQIVFKAQSTLRRMGGNRNSAMGSFRFIVAVRKLQCHDFCIKREGCLVG